MAKRNPLEVSGGGISEDTFNKGKLSTSVWRMVTADLGTQNGYTSLYSVNNINMEHGMLQLRLNQTGGVSTGAKITSRTRFNYGIYEFVFRTPTTASVPTAAANQVEGTITEFGIFYDGGVGGYNLINFKHDSHWTRTWELTVTNSRGSGTTSTVLPVPNAEQGFITIKMVWEPDRIEYHAQGKLVATVTENIPSIAANMFFGVRGTNDQDDGGLATPNTTRYAYLSFFRYAPSSTNLARNNSFETKFLNTPRPLYYAAFTTGGPEGVEAPVTWGAPAGRTGGTALSLTAGAAHGFNNYSPGPPEILPSRWGFRTASWEDPDPLHKPFINQAGIKQQWIRDVWYTVTFYAKKINGSSWSNLGLSWSSPPNYDEVIENPALTTEWQRYAFRWIWSNPTEEFGNFYVNVVGPTAAGDTLIVDDLDIYLGTEVRDYVPEASLYSPPIVVTGPSSPLPAKVLSTYWTGYQIPGPLDQLPPQYNHVFLFQMEPDGLVDGKGSTGAVIYPYYSTTPVDEIQALRARGVKVSTTFGGAGAAMYFQNRTQSNTFLSTYAEIYNNLGGVDGCDFNNYEQFSAEPMAHWRTPNDVPTMAQWLAKGHYPASQGQYSIDAWDRFNTEMVYIAGQLKSMFGSNFTISTPAAVGQGYAPNDRRLVQAMIAAGVLDVVQPQFYDSPDVIDPAYLKTLCDNWIDVTLNGDESKFGIAMATNYAGFGSSIPQAVESWNLVEAAHPNLRLAACWNAHYDGTNNWAFAESMYPIVRG